MIEGTEQKLWYLRRLNLFAALEPREIEAISEQLRHRSYRRRESVLDPRAPDDYVYLVKAGSVRLYRLSAAGRELTTAILRPGQLFGTAALVGSGERAMLAEALEDSLICSAGAEEFLRIVSSHPLLAARVLVALARQSLRLEQQLEHFAFQEAPTRVAQALLQLAEDHGGHLPQRLTHSELAKLVGTRRETVSKALAQFAARGLVEVGYRRLEITDWDGVRREAGLGKNEGEVP